MMKDERPWGFFEVLLDAPGYKVKRIQVHAGKRLSLQQHSHRCEHWHVVSGTARVTRDDETLVLSPGDSVDIPIEAWHRAHNPAGDPLIFIEVQRGKYLGEDDIRRKEDDYGRVP